MKDCVEHINEIRLNRSYRANWAENHISGDVIAKYMIDHLENNIHNMSKYISDKIKILSFVCIILVLYIHSGFSNEVLILNEKKKQKCRQFIFSNLSYLEWLVELLYLYFILFLDTYFS